MPTGYVKIWADAFVKERNIMGKPATQPPAVQGTAKLAVELSPSSAR